MADQSTDRPISALFLAVTRWLEHYGHVPSGPEPRILRVSGPEGIEISLNRSAEEREGLAPFTMKLVQHGWPIAVLNPFGGICMGAGEPAERETKLIETFEETVP